MGLWLSRQSEPDYDTYLAGLQEQISARQAKLQQIRLRERRANALFITYGVGLWVLYTVLWYFGVVPGSGKSHMLDQVGRAAPLVAGPVVIIFTRRFSRWFYHRKQDKEEATLKILTKKKQDKVEEIKKKTGYYSTRDLLEKYDEALKNKALATPGSAPDTPAKQQPANPTAAKPGIPYPSGPGTPARPASMVGFPTPQQQQHLVQQLGQQIFPAPAVPQPPPTPQSRGVMDKFADALLGVSAEEAQPSKYALICGKCYSHNGLVPPAEFEYIQYQCPRCGFFNPRRREPASSSQSGSQQVHRRVQSEFSPPSPLHFSSVAASTAACGDPAKQDQIDVEREEEREVAETLLAGEEMGKGRGTRSGKSTTALKETGAAQKRRGRKSSEGDEGEGEDKMDTD
ncbi:hypothetical protein JCM11641_006683 [Rhodosporidiobolus odoratus]